MLNWGLCSLWTSEITNYSFGFVSGMVSSCVVWDLPDSVIQKSWVCTSLPFKTWIEQSRNILKEKLLESFFYLIEEPLRVTFFFFFLIMSKNQALKLDRWRLYWFHISRSYETMKDHILWRTISQAVILSRSNLVQVSAPERFKIFQWNLELSKMNFSQKDTSFSERLLIKRSVCLLVRENAVCTVF